jgi:hypothetical protein
MFDDARSLVILAFADELCSDPLALAAYGALFGADDDATLVIYAPDQPEAVAVSRLMRALEGAGVSAHSGPDMTVLAVPGGRASERLLADNVHAVYSRRSLEGPLAALPRYGTPDVVGLRDLASPARVREPGPGPVLPVVMAVWQRIEFLPTTIAMLERQAGVRPELHLWVNNVEVADTAHALAAAASIPVHVTISPENIGGIGRFHAARKLAGAHPFVVFVDDDQTFADDALRVMLDEVAPGSMLATYGFQMDCPHSYWQRRLPKPGDWIQYAGTCGMIADTAVFADDRLFDCPERYTFVEDLWLSFFAEHELGWSLRRSRAPFHQIDDGRNQWRLLGPDLKSEFVRHLVAERGWQVPARPVSADAQPWGVPPGAGCDCAIAAAAA